LRNSGLDEDSILATIKRETGIFVGLPEPATRIVDYGFTEILNNAIEHSHSPSIQVTLARTPERVHFRIFDRGVGIFANLQESMHLESELDAVRQLLKGKQTTAPEAHTGEGIYFTSRSADLFSIQSGQTLLLFNNFLPDVFVRKLPRSLHGTSVNFTISANTERDIEKIFSEHTNEGYVFDKTTVRVKLYKLGSPYISRSQARRITSGLDRFALIILDFAEVDTVGQAFADEVFRVWQRQHPQVTIQVENANEAVNFMIRHAQTTET
jgi:anti-sigma regulatory factor (Ser/Thr protein kinase)